MIALWARAKRVMLSRRMATSFFISTSLLAFSNTIFATCAFLAGGSSKVEATTSPLMLLLKSVTSSGLSATRRTIKKSSGWFFSIDLAIVFRSVVFPARGGDTISPRWPFPIGVKRSITRAFRFFLLLSSNFTFSKGYRGVRLSKYTFLLSEKITSGWVKLMASILISAKYFSPSLGGRTIPDMVSPVLSWNFRIWEGET